MRNIDSRENIVRIPISENIEAYETIPCNKSPASDGRKDIVDMPMFWFTVVWNLPAPLLINLANFYTDYLAAFFGHRIF